MRNAYGNLPSFKSFIGTDPGWGTSTRRKMCLAACRYFGFPTNTVGSNPSDGEIISMIKNGLMVTFHSVLHSPEIYLEGSSLDKVRTDEALVRKQREEVFVKKIQRHPNYEVKSYKDSGFFDIQFGGRRAKGEMCKQALGFWKPEYGDTWDMAFNELTWTVRSTRIYYNYEVDPTGCATVRYTFEDVLDLRPGNGRSVEYNAICTVLGFLYHDVLGNSDQLKVKARWTTQLH